MESRTLKRQVMPINRPLPPIPNKPVAAPLPAPPALAAKESNWTRFRNWLKDTKVISGSLSHLSRLQILNKYKEVLAAAATAAGTIGYGQKRKTKMIRSHKKLIDHIHQHGGSWGSFVDWIKGAANKVADTAKNVGNKVADAGKFVYKRAIRPGLEYARDKPLSTLAGIAKVGSYLPIPGVSQGLSAASTALGTAGLLTGKGQEGGSRVNFYGKVLVQF